MDEREQRIATVAATLRTLLVQAGALRAIALLDRGEAHAPLVVDYSAAGELEVAEGEDVRALDPDALTAASVPLPAMRPLHGLEVDPDAGTIAAPIGALDAVIAALRVAARAFGGRSVVTAAFATADPEQPMFLAAREGEPLVVSVGEAEFELAR